MSEQSKCGNANPGSTINSGCGQQTGHDGNHGNGYSEWTKAQGARTSGSK